MHKGIEVKVLLDGEALVETDSLRLHYDSTFHQIMSEHEGWQPFIAPLQIQGGSVLIILMKAGEFADASED